MCKRFFCSLVLLLLFTGCNAEKKVIEFEINCFTEDSSFILKLQNGQVVQYIDSIEGDLGEDIVDILNDEYLTGVTDNDSALKIMNNSLSPLGGFCR